MTQYGIVHVAQIQAACALLPIEIKYVVTYPNGRVDQVVLARQAGFNRAMPLLTPTVRTPHYKITAYAKVSNIKDYLAGLEMCQMRNNSVAHVVRMQFDPISTNFLEDDSDDFALERWGRPITPEPTQGAGLDEGFESVAEPQYTQVQPHQGDVAAKLVQDNAAGKDELWNATLSEMRKYNLVQEIFPLPDTTVAPAGTANYDDWSGRMAIFTHRIGTVDPIATLRLVPMDERNRMAKIAASFYRQIATATPNLALAADAESTAYAFDGLVRATATCPALNTEELAELTGGETFATTDETMRKFMIAGRELVDLIEPEPSIRGAARDQLERAGERATATNLIKILAEMKRDRDRGIKDKDPESGPIGPPGDEPGKTMSIQAFGEATSSSDLKSSSLGKDVDDVAEETGTSECVMQFTDPGTSSDSRQ